MTGTINETYFEGLEDVGLASIQSVVTCKLTISQAISYITGQYAATSSQPRNSRLNLNL